MFYTDAGRQLQAIRAADTLESNVDVDQEGEGIAAKLRDLAVRSGKEALQRKLASTTSVTSSRCLTMRLRTMWAWRRRMLATLRRRLTFTWPQTSAERTAMIEAYRRQRWQCTAALRDEVATWSPSEGAPTTTMLRRTATWPLAGSGRQTDGSALRPTPDNSRRCLETIV